ncbi:MAG: aminopeptidase P N-terminal domain-containing protein, partial [Bacteroidales bacterium]
MFAKEIYVSRRNALKKAVGSGVLLFLGNDEAAMNYADNQYRFRQDSTFLYFFDFHVNAGVAAIIDIDNDRETVFGDEATIDDIVWTGKLQSIHDTAAEVGVGETLPCSKLREVLREALAEGRKIHFLPAYRPEQVLKIQNLLGLSPAEQANAIS